MLEFELGQPIFLSSLLSTSLPVFHIIRFINSRISGGYILEFIVTEKKKDQIIHAYCMFYFKQTF